MKRVQHNEIKPGMKIKVDGRWHAIHAVHGSAFPESRAVFTASYVQGADASTFTLHVNACAEGFELHPQAALIDAQAHQRKGRADAQNIVLREYSIKLSIVDRVDNQGWTCGYCSGANTITTNIYAHVFSESNAGRVEESAWSTCTTCTVYSLDQVEDVDPSHTIIIERVAL